METNDPGVFDTSDTDPPKKYIRTFEGDIETLQQGGTPDLAPLTPPRPQERLIEESPIVVKEPVKVMPSAPVSTPFRKPAPVPPPEPPAVAPLETYSGDFSDRLKEKHASTATVLAAEQDSAPRETRPAPSEDTKPSRAGVLYVIAGVVLVLAGGTGAYIAYSRYTAANAPVVSVQGAAAPIFVDERQEISGSGQALLKAIMQSNASALSGNLVRLLYIASTTESVFAQLPVDAPLILVRNVNADGSMAGIVNVNGVQNPFFILSVASYSNTFAGMLAWETLMQRDLNPLFPAYPPIFVATTTTTKTGQATTTTVLVATTKPGFRDEVVSNHDARVYRDAAGRVLLIYGYWNQSTLVIARDAAAFSEVLGRLANSRTR